MKYLIDTVEKQVGSLARQYKNLKADDEYLIYDPYYCNIDGKDFLETSETCLKDGQMTAGDVEDDGDTRRMKFTTDFESALAWCDCYVTFFSIPFILGTCGDTTAAQIRVDRLLERIGKAEELDKKIYLGNVFSEEFEEIAHNYKNSLNTFITEDSLDALSEYNGQFQAGYIGDTKITMVVGTNSSCGKFSCALKVKKQFEDKGEKVVLIHTEESYPFLDDQDGTIQGFCRNFSELTTDQDLEYLQCLVIKIISEQHPDRIIFVTQAGIGINGVLGNSPMTKNGKKMKGVWDILIPRSFGLDSVVICSHWDTVPLLEKLVYYYNIRGAEIDEIFITPVAYGSSFSRMPDEQSELFYNTSVKGDESEIEAVCKGLAINHPNIPIICGYGGITEKVEAFKNEKSFKEDVVNKFKTDIEIMVNNLNLADDSSENSDTE